MHMTSGKAGYNLYSDQPRIKLFHIPKEQLIEILRNEDQLRSSKEYQDKYSEKDSLAWFRDVTLEIQTKALLNSGISRENLAVVLPELWSARGEYLYDPDVNTLTVYQRKDRSKDGTLYPGCTMPNASLWTMTGEITNLQKYISSFKNPDLPLFIIAGSVS